jgi:hypothetical protein
MKWKLAACLLVVPAVCYVGGCSSSGSSSSTQPVAAADTQPSKPIPPDSIFAKVKMGEERDQVYATIGQPNSVGAYVTGKAFIPFHFSGSDDTRIVAHYKGVGTIIFGNDSAYTSGYSVVDIQYDPTDQGY